MNTAPPVPPENDAALHELVGRYQNLSLDNLSSLLQLYSDDAWFKDPFNQVTGRAAIGKIFTHMFRTVHEPRFAVTSALRQGDQAFLVWEFRFRRRSATGSAGAELCVHGSTHLRYSARGLVCYHRDYWDAAEELYEKFPLIGAVLRRLKRALRTPI